MRTAAILVLVGAACQSKHAVHEPSPNRRAADDALLYRLDHVLTTYRVPMCHELDLALPNLAPPPPRSIEAMTAACDGGDAASCYALGRLWEPHDHSDIEHQVIFGARPDLEHFFGRACDLGSDAGCRALDSVFDREDKPRARLALTFALFYAGRTEMSAGLWLGLPPAERAVFAPSLAALRTKLEADCASGNATACEARAGFEPGPDASWQPGPWDPKKRPWFIKGCLAGSLYACEWALAGLDPTAVDRTEAIVDRVCHGPTCDGLVAALRDSCRAGVWSSCYLAADACKQGGTVPGPSPAPARPDVIFIPADPPARSID